MFCVFKEVNVSLFFCWCHNHIDGRTVWMWNLVYLCINFQNFCCVGKSTIREFEVDKSWEAWIELKRGSKGSIWADMFVINCACMGRSNIYQCGGFKHMFYLLGNHFVVRSLIDGVSVCLGCLAW